MPKPIEKLTVIDGETLQDMRLQPGKFTIDMLLPQGISMLGGAPKNGKSWMVLEAVVPLERFFNLSLG